MRAVVLKRAPRVGVARGGLLRSGLARVALVAALGLVLLGESACVADVAYEMRLGQAARKHTYTVSREKLLAAAEKAAVADGWSVEAVAGGLAGRQRERGGRKEKLTVTVVEEGGGRRLEADLEVEGPVADPSGAPRTQTSKMHASKLEVAVLDELEPKAADEAKKKARAEAKEDAKLVRACGRRAVDLATEGAD